MATIERRTDKQGNTSFRVKVRLKGRPTQTASFNRLTDARKWASSIESAIREGRHFKTSAAKKTTLAELIDQYCQDVLPNKRNYKRQFQQLQWWKGQIGAYALADVDSSLIAKYRNKLANTPTREPKPEEPPENVKRSPASVVRYLAALSHVFTIAVKEYKEFGLEHNPVKDVAKPTESRGRVRYLSDDERPRLLQACQKSHNLDLYPAVLLSLCTGARQMEVLGLRWPQVDLKRGILTFEQTKNGERRSVPVTGPALDILRERSKIHRLDTDLVFPGGNPKHPVWLRKAWGKALSAAEIQDFRWHDLRHSAASYLAMNGATSSEIAEILGHKTLAMIKRYSHLSPEHVRGVLERMNSAVFSEVSG